jgi:signal transduction histidine kinase
MIPLILIGIIAFSILSSVALYIAQEKEYKQIVKNETDELKGELSEKSFYVSQISSEDLANVAEVTKMITSAKSFQSGDLNGIKLLLDAAESDSSNIVDAFFILDKNGVLQYSTATDPATQKIIGTSSFSDHAVYVKTKETLKPFISPLTNAVTDNSLVFYVASPIIDQLTDEFRGTVSAKIRADTFAKHIEKLVVARPADIGSSSLTLIDPNGNIMYSASSTNLGKNVLSEEVIGAIPASIKDGLVASLKEAVSGTSGIYEINLKEHPELNTSNSGSSGSSTTAPTNPFDYVLFAYDPVKVENEIVMISFVTKSANLETILSENEILGGAYLYVFIYGTLGTMTAFGFAVIIINTKLSSKVEAKTNELEKTNKELEKTNKELAYSAKEISEQAKKLRELDIEKEEFSAMITHELKTPLVPVIGYSELLLDGTLGGLNEKQRETVQVMNSSAVSLSKLISDLLDVRKLELGKMQFQMRDCSSKELIEDCLKAFELIAQAKRVSLASKTKPEMIEILKLKCDPKRIRQVLDNLVNNAIKFAPAATGKIEVSIRTENEGALTIFAVKDNGVGIPSEKHINIFKKFYQADTSMTRNAGGTGLGLAICKAIVEAHGGRIWFESKAGVGSTFYFSIPAKLKSSTPLSNGEMRSRNSVAV